MSSDLDTLVKQLADLATSQVNFNLNLQRNLTALMAAVISILSTLKERDPELGERLVEHLEAQAQVLSPLTDLDCSEQIRYFINILQGGAPPSDDHPTPPWFRGIVPGGRPK